MHVNEALVFDLVLHLAFKEAHAQGGGSSYDFLLGLESTEGAYHVLKLLDGFTDAIRAPADNETGNNLLDGVGSERIVGKFRVRTDFRTLFRAAGRNRGRGGTAAFS